MTTRPSKPIQGPSLDALFNRGFHLVSQLATAIIQRRATRLLFKDVEGMLETLPLATEHYASARCHLRNALDYYCDGENGAALFEVRLITQGFDQRT